MEEGGKNTEFNRVLQENRHLPFLTQSHWGQLGFLTCVVGPKEKVNFSAPEKVLHSEHFGQHLDPGHSAQPSHAGDIVLRFNPPLTCSLTP